ncbi:MAG: hypothetical protein C0605_07710 [Hyphomicrobiales bacterium]|nr:MAG: hypothetical protein C0605_07710 [Hyphomicrobiales bacterium]
MKDFHSNMKAVVAIAAAALDADPTAVTIDLKGYDGAEFVLEIGAGGITFDATNKIEYKLTESDDDSTYTAVADADVLGASVATGGIVKSLVAAHAAAAVYRFGYRGSKRYLQLVPDFSGTHGTATPMAAVALLRGTDNPQADQI